MKKFPLGKRRGPSVAEGANEGVEASPNASLTTANCNAQKPKRPQKGGEKETEGARRGLPSQGKQEQNRTILRAILRVNLSLWTSTVVTIALLSSLRA